jgi:mercuric ion binding protein
MKSLILCLLILLPQLSFAKDQVLTVNGLVCSFCAQGIEKNFKKDSRVESVKVDLKNKKIFITLKPNQTISEQEYRTILSDAGYSLVTVE